MTTPVQTPLRGLRATVFGTSALLLAAAAHVVAGGRLPSSSVLLTVGVPLGCASVVLARHVRRLPTLVAFLALGQVVMHEVFMTAAAPPSCGAGVGPAHAMAGMHAASAPTGTCAPVMHMATHAAASPAMLVAHALAVVATALLLGHGERVALRLWQWSRPRVVRGLVAAPVPAVVRSACAVTQLAPQLLLHGDVSRRGPPRGASPVPTFA